ncbi:MAG: Crp/Fnr family transcriptional regulator [Proteobacteria bacterium]|nr:MAG: Crp/Fnr family transcriptional regulator [Pseudomonadota bacterium]
MDDKYLLETILIQLNSTELLIKKGEQLFTQGDSITSFYHLQTGRIKLIRNTLEGGESLIHVALSGETLAEASLFSNEYHCSAIAIIESKVRCYKKHDFLQLIEKNTAIMKKLLQIFSQQVRDLRTINEIKNIHSARDRVLTFIKSEMDDKREITLTISLKDVAYKIGLAHETFYRELKKLEKHNIIKRNGSTLKLLSSSI